MQNVQNNCDRGRVFWPHGELEGALGRVGNSLILKVGIKGRVVVVILCLVLQSISRFFEMGLSMPEVVLISGHK